MDPARGGVRGDSRAGAARPGPGADQGEDRAPRLPVSHHHDGGRGEGPGLDRKNGIDLEPHSYGAVSAYYAALATGEVDVTPAGPHVLQKMRTEGVPIKAALTYARLNAMAGIAADPPVKTVASTKGELPAAPMGPPRYQFLARD